MEREKEKPGASKMLMSVLFLFPLGEEGRKGGRKKKKREKREKKEREKVGPKSARSSPLLLYLEKLRAERGKGEKKGEKQKEREKEKTRTQWRLVSLSSTLGGRRSRGGRGRKKGKKGEKREK